MNLLNENYRQFNLNFLSSNRLVFAETPQGVDTQTSAPKSTTSPAPSAPFTGKDFEHHQKRFDSHIAKLPAAVATTVRQIFAKRLAEIKKNYNDQLKALKNSYGTVFETPDQMAAAHVRPKVDLLIADIQKHLPNNPANTPANSASKPTAVAKQSNANDKAPKNSALVQKAADIIARGMNAEAKLLVVNLINSPKFKFTPAQIKQLSRGQLELSPAQKKSIKDQLPDNTIQPANSSELKPLKDFISKVSPKLSKYFENSKSPGFILLSQHFQVTAKGGGLQLVRGSNKLIVKTQADLINALPTKPKDTKKAFQDFLLGRTKEKEFEQFLKNSANANIGYINVREAMTSREALKKVGLLGQLKVWLQIWAHFSKAFKTGDFKELGDYMKALKKSNNSPRKMAQIMKEAQAAYPKSLDERAPKAGLNLLLNAYLKPRSSQADELFYHNMRQKGLTSKEVGDSPLTQFRSLAKPAIRAHLGKAVGMDISTIRMNRGYVELVGFQDGKKAIVQIKLGEKGAKAQARVLQYERKTDSKGKNTDTLLKGDRSMKPVDLDPNRQVTLLQQLGGQRLPQQANSNPSSVVSLAPKNNVVASQPKTKWTSAEISNMKLDDFSKMTSSLIKLNPKLKDNPEYKEVNRLVELRKTTPSYATTPIEEQLVEAYRTFATKYALDKK